MRNNPMRPAGALIALLVVSLLLSACGGSSSSSSSPTALPTKSTSTMAGGKSLGLLKSDLLTVCSDATYPPMEYSDPSHPGQYIGADVDLASALARAIGVASAKILNTPFDSIIPALQAKRCDIVMSSMSDTPLRRKTVSFVDYMTTAEGILVNKSSSIHASSYSGLCGKTVAVERGTTELDGLNAASKSCSSKIHVLSFTADTDAFQAFASGHADAYTGDLPVVAHYVQLHPTSYRQAGTAIKLASEPYGIAVRKSDAALRTALQGAVAKIRANGTYAKILKKWGVGQASLA